MSGTFVAPVLEGGFVKGGVFGEDIESWEMVVEAQEASAVDAIHTRAAVDALCSIHGFGGAVGVAIDSVHGG